MLDPYVMPAKKAAKKAVTPAPATKAARKTAKPSAKSVTPKAANRAAETPEFAAVPDIEKAAYYRYLDRIGQGLPGDALGDWLAAEISCRS